MVKVQKLSLLFFRPNFDEITRYSSEWCKALLDFALRKGYNIIDLARESATKIELEKRIHNSVCLIFYDHGDLDKLYAQNGSAAVDKNNLDLFKGRSIYTLACLSAKDLGPEAIRKGVLVYWGFNKTYGFFPHQEKIFKEQANIGFIELLNCHSFGKAREIFIKRTLEMVEELDRRGESIIADQLLWNLNAHEVIGDKNKTL